MDLWYQSVGRFRIIFSFLTLIPSLREVMINRNFLIYLMLFVVLSGRTHTNFNIEL